MTTMEDRTMTNDEMSQLCRNLGRALHEANVLTSARGAAGHEEAGRAVIRALSGFERDGVGPADIPSATPDGMTEVDRWGMSATDSDGYDLDTEEGE